MGWDLNQDLRAVTDPHLQIRGGPGHPDPDIRWVGAGVGVSGLKKKTFLALRASVWSKNKRWGGGGGVASEMVVSRQTERTLLAGIISKALWVYFYNNLTN